jgi:hypothetical protein
MAAQSTVEASKKEKEVDFHVESQHIAERTLPYLPISWIHHCGIGLIIGST